MIQLVINTNMLREINERSLINHYARLLYTTEEDVTNEIKIRENLEQLFDWDINGDNGLCVYCSKFEKIKNKDWKFLIDFIKNNAFEIKTLSYSPAKRRKLEQIKKVNTYWENKEKHNLERFSNENYTLSGRGVKARSCIYNGKEYKSRMECIYKEGITKAQLYKYLKETNQV